VRFDTIRAMQKLLQEVLDKQKEASFLLWQALLTINGFIATIVVGIAAFSPISSSPIWVRLLVALILVAILISSGLIARIFYLVGFSYKNMGEMIKDVKEGHKRIEDVNIQERMTSANNIHSQIAFAEKTTLVLQVIISVILVALVLYLLFFQNSVNALFTHNLMHRQMQVFYR